MFPFHCIAGFFKYRVMCLCHINEQELHVPLQQYLGTQCNALLCRLLFMLCFDLFPSSRIRLQWFCAAFVKSS